MIGRRPLLAGMGTLLALPAARAAAAARDAATKLTVAAGVARLIGPTGAPTRVWAYNGRSPGPVLRVRQGERLQVLVDNKLSEGTTIHWHGVRLPNAMDGVPGLTQPVIQPGAAFLYDFVVPDAGTYWYHPHANSLEQIGRGLAGVLIVEEPSPPAVDRDLVWMISDWRLDEHAQLAPGFRNPMEAAMSGRVGNTVSINGVVAPVFTVVPGERIRLRLVNSALARICSLRFTGHAPSVVAVDGQPCEPHPLPGGRLLLGPAMRADLILEMTGAPGGDYPVVDAFYDGLSYTLARWRYGSGPPHAGRSRGPLRLPANPLPLPDLRTAIRHRLDIEGGMPGVGRFSRLGAEQPSHADPAARWALNGQSVDGDGHAGSRALLNLKRGESCVLTLRNRTAWWHPMHLHGHTFRLLRRNGVPAPYEQWADTVLLAPADEVQIAFVADNPGDWMFHCHVTDHQVSGLAAIMNVA